MPVKRVEKEDIAKEVPIVLRQGLRVAAGSVSERCGSRRRGRLYITRYRWKGMRIAYPDNYH